MKKPEDQNNLFLAVILSMAVLFLWQYFIAAPHQRHGCPVGSPYRDQAACAFKCLSLVIPATHGSVVVPSGLSRVTVTTLYDGSVPLQERCEFYTYGGFEIEAAVSELAELPSSARACRTTLRAQLHAAPRWSVTASICGVTVTFDNSVPARASQDLLIANWRDPRTNLRHATVSLRSTAASRRRLPTLACF